MGDPDKPGISRFASKEAVSETNRWSTASCKYENALGDDTKTEFQLHEEVNVQPWHITEWNYLQ